MTEEKKALLNEVMKMEFGEKTQREFFDVSIRSYIHDRCVFYSQVRLDLITQFYESKKEHERLEQEKASKTGLELEAAKLTLNRVFSETSRLWAEIERLRNLMNKYVGLYNQFVLTDSYYPDGVEQGNMQEVPEESIDEIMVKKPKFRLPEEDRATTDNCR